MRLVYLLNMLSSLNKDIIVIIIFKALFVPYFVENSNHLLFLIDCRVMKKPALFCIYEQQNLLFALFALLIA